MGGPGSGKKGHTAEKKKIVKPKLNLGPPAKGAITKKHREAAKRFEKIVSSIPKHKRGGLLGRNMTGLGVGKAKKK